MKTGQKILIVNADDLGRSAGVNDGVFAAHRGGVVSSATLMVGFPAAAAAAREWAAQPDLGDLGIGLHVTLSGGGAPLLPPDAVRSLVDGAGRLPPRPEALAGADAGEVLAEVRAQLARFRALCGRLPTHLDGHHHCHRLPVVLDALVAVAGEHGLPVRNASLAVAARLRGAGVATTDFFVERFFGAEARLEVLLDVVASLAPGTTELMCHPAVVDEELRSGSTYVAARARELEVLTHPEARRALAAAGVALASFGALRGELA